MNAFQKQLLLNGKNMAEISGQHRVGIGRAIPPVKVSVEDFLRDVRCACNPSTCGTDWRNICSACGLPRISKVNSPKVES